jgi:hypothetical protein
MVSISFSDFFHDMMERIPGPGGVIDGRELDQGERAMCSGGQEGEEEDEEEEDAGFLKLFDDAGEGGNAEVRQSGKRANCRRARRRRGTMAKGQ